MINLSLNELKLVAKSISIKVYENKSETELTKILSKLEPKLKFSKQKIKDIRKKLNELWDRFSKPKIKEIRRNIYRMEAKKNERNWNNLFELEKNLCSLKKYYGYDDIKI